MRYLTLATCGLMLVTVGCNVKKTNERQAAVDSTTTSNASLLEPLLLPTKPAEAKTVAELRQKGKTGDEVILQGTVPPDAVKPFGDGMAWLVLMDAADLADETVQAEFACPNAEDCPACRKVLDEQGVRVEIVSKPGAMPVRSTLQGFKGLKGGSTITVKGKLEKDGKKLLIRATAFYVG